MRRRSKLKVRGKVARANAINESTAGRTFNNPKQKLLMTARDVFVLG